MMGEPSVGVWVAAVLGVTFLLVPISLARILWDFDPWERPLVVLLSLVPSGVMLILVLAGIGVIRD